MKPIRSWSLVMVFCLAIGLRALVFSAPGAGLEKQARITADAASVDILDGKKFNGVTGEKGKKGHHEDTLSFSNGMFTSSACLSYGFASGPYTVSVEGDHLTFRAETISPKLGKMQWQGTLKGDTLQVTYNWTKKRWLWTTFRQYWFKGHLVKQ